MKGCRVLEMEEWKLIKELLHQRGWIREEVLYLTSLNFGLRVEESLALRFRDVSGQFLYVVSEKGSENQTFRIDEARGYRQKVFELSDWYEKRGVVIDGKTPLFMSQKGMHIKQAMSRNQVAVILRGICRQLGIQGKVGIHSFRKMYVTRIYELSGRDTKETQKYSRHKNMASLPSYIATTEGTPLIGSLNW